MVLPFSILVGNGRKVNKVRLPIFLIELMSQRRIRVFRIIGFATIYFFIFIASAIYFLIQSHPGSSQLSWYLQNPWVALRTIFDYIFFEAPQNPLLMFTILLLILQSLVLGFATDWVSHILLKRRK